MIGELSKYLLQILDVTFIPPTRIRRLSDYVTLSGDMVYYVPVFLPRYLRPLLAVSELNNSYQMMYMPPGLKSA